MIRWSVSRSGYCARAFGFWGCVTGGNRRPGRIGAPVPVVVRGPAVPLAVSAVVGPVVTVLIGDAVVAKVVVARSVNGGAGESFGDSPRCLPMSAAVPTTRSSPRPASQARVADRLANQTRRVPGFR